MYNPIGLRSDRWKQARLFLSLPTTLVFGSLLKTSKSPLNSIIITLGLSLGAGLSVWALWIQGFLGPLQQAFIVHPADPGVVLITAQFRLATLLILATGLGAGLTVERAGARRAFPYLGGGFLILSVISLLLSRFFGIDILFVPMAFAGVSAVLLVQAYRLWSLDLDLTNRVNSIATRTVQTTENDSKQRLLSGLKLLDTVLAVSDAIVFARDADHNLVPAARLQPLTSEALGTSRNSAWREGVTFSEQAIAAGTLISRPENNDSTVLVALPLRHEDRTVGALLIRLRESFSEDDRPLVLAVATQIARNLQREETSKSAPRKGPFTYFSAGAAEQRLESVYMLSGLLTEERFGAQALSESSDGLALAYLDGTLAHVNSQLLRAAQLTEGDSRKLDMFGLLDRFRSDIFDEPAIAVRRVLQTGEPYERELQIADRNQTLGLKISLLSDLLKARAGVREPLCLALSVRDLTHQKEYDQLKSDMISLMSHELRTPLTSINGFAELLAADEAVPAHLKEFVTIINNEAQRPIAHDQYLPRRHPSGKERQAGSIEDSAQAQRRRARYSRHVAANSQEEAHTPGRATGRPHPASRCRQKSDHSSRQESGKQRDQVQSGAHHGDGLDHAGSRSRSCLRRGPGLRHSTGIRRSSLGEILSSGA